MIVYGRLHYIVEVSKINAYERLINEAYNKGICVREQPLASSDGRINGRRIAISKRIKTSAEKACVLAEEIGHFETGVGDILNQSYVTNRKQERQARVWAFNKRIGLIGIVYAYKLGCRTLYDMAEVLGVTEEFAQECIECYRAKYGVYTKLYRYCIVFIPYLKVLRLK